MLTVLYKIAAKAIALRIMPFLQRGVSPHQHGFIKGRSIYDNILAAMVGVDFARLSNQNCLLLQLDQDKAYDRIQWSFIFAVMDRMGFGPKMASAVVHLAQGCISQLLVNQWIVGHFALARSVRQGCPVAPLFFALATHPFIVSLQAAAQGGKIKGLMLPQGDQLLVKMFADDSLLFLQDDSIGLRNALQVVQDFSLASGSKCNIEKSKLIQISEDNNYDPSLWLGEIVHPGTIVRHLGAPLGVGVSSRKKFDWVMHRVRDKMHRWDFVDLSFWARLKVIRSILMSYLLFYIPFLEFNQARWNVFLRPIKLFLWRKSYLQSRAMHWASWESVCRPREYGGLAIPNLPIQAVALHAKFLAAFHSPSQDWVFMLVAILQAARVWSPGGVWKHFDWKKKLMSSLSL